MSELGQTRLSQRLRGMSVLTLKGDIRLLGSQVSFVPIGDIITHSMISSARASTDGGTVRPSAFAVLRLMTSSYLVGA
jgi:hypothetical protein